MRRWLVAAALAALLGALAPVGDAHAAGSVGEGQGGDASSNCTGDECEVGARLTVPGSRGSGGGSGSPGGSRRPLTCLFFGQESDTDLPAAFIESAKPGDTVWVRCWSDADMTTPYGSAWTITWGATDPTGPVLPPEDVAQSALESMRLLTPAPVLNPTADQVVNLPTWLHVANWAPVSRTATTGGVSATVTATPWRQRWSFGADGATATCYGPGAAYDVSRPDAAQRTDCSATFTRASTGQPGGAFTVTVTVDWQVSWTSNVAGRGGDLGVLSSTTTRQVRVGEIQILNN